MDYLGCICVGIFLKFRSKRDGLDSLVCSPNVSMFNFCAFQPNYFCNWLRLVYKGELLSISSGMKKYSEASRANHGSDTYARDKKTMNVTRCDGVKKWGWRLTGLHHPITGKDHLIKKKT